MADSRRSAGRTRLGRRTLIAALALDATAAATPVAAAQAPDPMTTNIPYTAWAGTQLRLVKCSNDLEGLSRRGLDVLVEEWSGSDNYRPQVVDASIDYVRSSKRDDQRCARFNVVSNGDGIASGFDVHVGRATLDGPCNDLIHQPDNRRFVGDIAQALDVEFAAVVA